MEHTNHGGPAFPLARNHSSGDAVYARGDGMSLRDYFAAHALPQRQAANCALGFFDPDIHAREAYATADAMLRAREAK